MKKLFTFVALMLLCFSLNANAQWVINANTQQTENFDGIGTTATANLPTGWVGSAATNYTGTVVTATTLAYGTTGTGVVGSASSGGYINWANGITGSSTDRSFGFLTTGSFTSPRDIMVKIQNNTGVTVSNIDIAFDYEKSRSGSRQFDWTFFHGSDGSTWTSNTSGDQSYPADANNTVVSNPPLTTTKSFNVSGLTIANGGFYYFRWHFLGAAGGSTNGQGIGLDNVKLTLNAAGGLTPPTLTAAGGATVDNPFNVTFTDNASWRAAITSVTIGGVTLTAGYSVSAGQLTFTPSASNPANLLQTNGSKNIIVIATGYTNATVTQTIGVGAVNKLGLTTQPTAPISNGGLLAAQPVVAIQDQYGNTTTSTASVTAAVGSGTWTIGGTTLKSGVNGVATFTDLTATSAAAVSGATITFTSSGLTSVTSNGFNIPAPPLNYYSQGSLDPTQTSSWNDQRGGGGNPPAGFTNGDAFIIQNGHSMTTSQAWSISGSGGKLQIESGGTLTASFAITVSAGTTFQIDNNGTYNHNNTGVPASTIFAGTESFAPSSNFNLNSWQATNPAIPVDTYGNLTITYDPLATWQQSAALANIAGDFTLNNNSASVLRLCTGVNYTMNVGGNFNITSGSLQFNNGTAGFTYILNIGGNFNQTGGTFNPNTSTATLAINFTGTGKTYTESGTLTNSQINWTVNSGASMTLASDLLSANNRTTTVSGTLDLGSNNLTGGGTAATLAGNGTIKMAGSFASQVTGFTTNTFTGTYEFTGGSNQNLPAGTYANLKVNGAGITLTGDVVLSGALTMSSGNLTLGNFNISTVDIINGSASSYISTTGTGKITRTGLIPSSSETFPIGNGDYTPVTITNSSGPTEDYTVNVQNTIDNVPGSTNYAQKQWNISEATIGGSGATITFQWNAADEGALMQSELPYHSTTTIGHWTDSVNSGFTGYYRRIDGTISGSNPYTITSNTVITSFSPFLVGSSGVLPVELASFTSAINGRDVKLNWNTNSEVNNSGFDVERKSVTENATWSKVGNVTGNGTSNVSHSYSYTDRNVTTGNYSYRLKQIDNNGNYEYFALSNEVIIAVPTKFDLSQNYPNPFNPTTKINYDLPVDAKVSVRIIDMTGREVATLVNAAQTAGSYTLNFNASSLSSGVYFYQINAVGSQSFSKTMKMLLVK